MTTVSRAVLRLAGAVAAALVPVTAQAADSGASFISDLDVFGRVMFDYGRATGEDTAFDLEDTELRNARLGLSGKIGSSLKFKVEVHGDDSANVILTDAYLKYKASFAPFDIKLGQFKTPNSLDEQTSSRFTSMHERAAFTDAFEFDRRVGVGIGIEGDRFGFDVGVFGQNIEGPTFGGFAAAGRVTFSPVIGEDNLKVHTGLSVRYRDLDESQPDFKYRQRPVTHMPDRILNTGRIADNDFFTGGEFAMTKGRFWIASEYAFTAANCSLCASDPTFQGGYAEAGVIFGGRRVMKKGKFNRPEIADNDIGAFSLAFRFDTIDLSYDGLDGGAYNAFILGADWWPTDHLRFGVNAFLVDTDLGDIAYGLEPAFMDALSMSLTEERVEGFTLRAQLDF